MGDEYAQNIVCMKFSRTKVGAGKVTQQLRALALVEHPGSVLSTNKVTPVP